MACRSRRGEVRSGPTGTSCHGAVPWRPGGSRSCARPAGVHAGPYGLLDSFGSHSGLATSPPSASLASSFVQGFDAGAGSADLVPSYMAAGHVTTATSTIASMDACSQGPGGNLAAVTDPFLAHAYGEAHDGAMHGWNGQGVGGGEDHSSEPKLSASESWRVATLKMRSLVITTLSARSSR